MKIKITEPGWASFSENFGGVDFVDGVSVDDVSPAEARYLSSLIRVETLEGKNPSPAQVLIDNRHAGIGRPPVTETPFTPPAEPQKEPEDVADKDKVWTQAQLEAVADEKGIKGIRAIAEPLGLKDNSITDLIAKILSSQAQKPAAPTVTETPAA